MTILDPVRAAYRAGLCVLPVREDGSKAPDVPSWREWMTRRPTGNQMRAFNFGRRCGFGMVAGASSSYRECWDFDCLDTFHALIDAADRCGLGGTVDHIRAGYEDSTPGGGRRWIVRYPEGLQWRDCTLASRPGRDGEPEVKTLIELPTFAILAPSNGGTHPSGKAYVRLSGDFATIASYTAEEREGLVGLARSFDAASRSQASKARAAAATAARPGDDFAAQTTWPELLEPHGWRAVYTRGGTTYWRRPGKAVGISATTNHAESDLLFVFSSSTSFEPERGYSRFGAYAVLEHDGDCAHAAAALTQRGYGQQRDSRSNPTEGPHVGLELTALGDLLAEPDETVDYLVADRIASGSLNLLAGKPKAGKSTAARALALEVARGGTWLGFECKACPVWYLALEDKRAEVKRHFRQMGAKGADPVRFLFKQAGRDLVRQLQALAAQEGPGLIIVDTLQRLIRAKDLNDYSEVTSKLTPILALARETGAAVVLVHHAGKGARTGIDSVLGSTALAGSVDNVFLLTRTDSYRVLLSSQRIGPDLPETVVTLDQRTGRVDAGPNRHDADLARVEVAIVAAFEDSETPMTEEDLEATIEAKTSLKREALRALVKRGRIVREGKGRKGDRFLYRRPPPTAGDPEQDSCSPVPAYGQEQENTNSFFGENACKDGPNACSLDSDSTWPESKPREQESGSRVRVRF